MNSVTFLTPTTNPFKDLYCVVIIRIEMAKRKHNEHEHYYYPAKYPRYDDYTPIERDYYSLPVNNSQQHHHHKYHLRPREPFNYYHRFASHAHLSYHPTIRVKDEYKSRNAHSYSLNGHRFSNSSTASSRKRRLGALKEVADERKRQYVDYPDGSGVSKLF